MLFSLILATVDRIEEVSRFLASLDSQSHRDFELVIVDQNPYEVLAPIIEQYSDKFPLLHINNPGKRGVSRARNTGLNHIKGDVLTFPDDDCWYPPNLLRTVDNFLKDRPDVDSLSGFMNSKPNQVIANSQYNRRRSRFLTTRLTVAQIPGPWSLFLRRKVADMVGDYDETLGPGAETPWGAGEDTDYYLRVFNAGYNIFSNPDIVVYHPTPTKYYVQHSDLSRSYRYGAGRTRVWKRHHLPRWYFIYELFRSLIGMVISLLLARRFKAYWHWGAFRGKLRGWFSN